MGSPSTTEVRLYKSVAAYQSESLDYIIPNGQILSFIEIGINATPGVADTHVQIIWDPSGANENILSGYGDSVQKCTLQKSGDGSKVIRILLTNNDSNSRFLGGYFIGEVS